MSVLDSHKSENHIQTMREVRNEKQNRNDDNYVVFWVWTEMKARKGGGMELYKGVCGFTSSRGTGDRA